MHIFPAIDILGGRAVRLAQGDYDRVTVYNERPLAQALQFVEQGATYLHVVDLDGARTGKPTNTAYIAEIASHCGVPVEVGGGVRSLEAARELLDAGVARVVLGTKLATDHDFVRAAVAEFGAARLVAGVDARDGMVAVDGWEGTTSIGSAELIGQLAELGLRHLVYTDISRDGMQTGIDSRAYARVAAAAGFPVIVSGGVSTLDDIRAAAALGPEAVEGIICGRALYEGAFTLPEAIDALEWVTGQGIAPCLATPPDAGAAPTSPATADGEGS